MHTPTHTEVNGLLVLRCGFEGRLHLQDTGTLLEEANSGRLGSDRRLSDAQNGASSFEETCEGVDGRREACQ